MINIKGIKDMSDHAIDEAAQQESVQAATPDPEVVAKQRLANTRAKVNLTFQVIAPLLNAINKDDLQDYISNHAKIEVSKHPADKFTRKFANRLADMLELIDDQADLIRVAKTQAQGQQSQEQKTEDALVDSAVPGPDGVTVPMIPVKSSHIGYLGYETASKNLFVTFNDGTTFRYSDVPEEVADAFLNADSSGKFYHSDIKNNYKGEKISSGAAAVSETSVETETPAATETVETDTTTVDPVAKESVEIPGAQKPAVAEEEVAVESEQTETEVYQPEDVPDEDVPVEVAA